MYMNQRRKWDSQDVAKLVACLQGLPPVKKDPGKTSTSSAERLLDCVLSLNRDYRIFVEPRVERFGSKCPNVNTLADLAECVNRTGGHVKFYQDVLRYNYPDAAEMFHRVLNYLLEEMRNHPGTTDLERLASWAKSARIDGYRTIRTDANGDSDSIPLFGIAGWQYLRMLHDADTCKPDIAVTRFVKQCLGRRLSPVPLVEIMELAAPQVPTLRSFRKPVREADRRIWDQHEKPRKREKQSGCGRP